MNEAETEIDRTLRAVLRDVLGLSTERVNGMSESTLLFGALPEFDSMAVASLLTALEDRLAIIIDDDDVEPETFETFGKLMSFLLRKTLV